MKSVNGGHDFLGQGLSFFGVSGVHGGTDTDRNLISGPFRGIRNAHGNKWQAGLGQMFLETQKQLNEPVFARSHLIRDIGALRKKDNLFLMLQDTV